MRALLWLSLLWATATPAATDADVFAHPQTAQQLLNGVLASPAAALRNAQVLRGRFVYRRHLQGIPQPLVSRGDFVFARELGIDWHTREPIDSDFILTAAGITQQDDGRTTAALKASEVPAVRVIARIFLALLSLDMSALQGNFALSGLAAEGRWQVGMKPTAPAIAAVFRSAVLAGAAQVETLVLSDANGDRSEIQFQALQYGATLATDDRHRFEAAGKP